CEGGETIVAKQHMNSWYGNGKDYYAQGEYEKALEAFRVAQVIPDNLCAGLWHVDPLVPSQYYEALTLEKLGRADEAAKIYEYISGIYLDFFSDMYLPELPIYEDLSLKKIVREDESDALLSKYIERWQNEMKRVDSGYFNQQPFFISYLDDAKVERDAYYSKLLAFAYSAKDGRSEFLNI
ncbi:MAG: tetratricopeptide repeat protein, partial [Clostridia bacterium]|nr:tetratricopeptide repeat protein [Clostridia bacterium]